MKHKTYFHIVSLVFLFVALGHLLRALLGWDLVVNVMDIPAWASWLAALVTGYLAYTGFKLASGSLN